MGDGTRTALEKVLRSQWHPSAHGEVSRAVSDNASVIAQGVLRVKVDVQSVATASVAYPVTDVQFLMYPTRETRSPRPIYSG
ncbi:Uncharacterised protein [Vibrio cholerae]|nr:Uncharacterised protein [Vibrio cholerae]